MGKIKKKDVKKPEKLTAEASEDTLSKLSTVLLTSTEELNSPSMSTVPNTESVNQEEPLPPVPAAETYEEPVLNQLIVEKYEGELVGGLYEGEGVAYFRNGNIYKGIFSKGFMHGKGTYTWTDGLTYEGEFSMNCPMGYGVYTWPNGARYEGQVYKALRHGNGTYTSSDRKVSYVGEWYKGIRHGKGTIFYNAEGTSWYEGEWKNKNKDGWGVQRFKSGNIYEGQWINNKFHGMGRMKWLSSSEEYKGQWENGIQNGLGTHTWFLKRVPGSQYSLRNEYVGNFVNGVRHGKGRYYYANGAMYDGEWKNNKKHGMGKFIFKNGKTYTGEFVEDQIAEYPHFIYDRLNTPDLSGIRTQSPAFGENLNTSTSNSGIPSLSGSYIELDISSLLNTFPENERLHELRQVEYGVLRNLTLLRKTYKFYSRLGNENCFDNAFLMTKLQFWRFLKDCKLHHYKLTLSEMDRLLTVDNADPEEVHCPFATMLLRTFLTNIIYLAYHITHMENPEKKFSIVDCFSRIMERNVSLHASHVRGYLFCEAQKTELSMSYIDKSWDIYKAYCQRNSSPPYEPTMTMRHFIWMMKDLQIISNELNIRKIVDILAYDDPCVRDGNEINLALELTFLEFFEALFGCAAVYPTDELLDESANELAGEQDEKPVTDSSEDPGDHQPDLSPRHSLDYEIEEQDPISTLKANETSSAPVSIQSTDKRNKDIVTDKWFHQIDIFFTKLFFPAYERVEELKAEIPQNRIRQAEASRLQQIREEEEARLKALKAEEEANKMAQIELERALAGAVQLSADQAEDSKSDQQPATPKHEPSIAASIASTKTPPATGKKKKR